MQDASQKRTELTLHLGPTVGSVLRTQGRIQITVSPEKWAKTQSLVRELDSLLCASPSLPKLRLEQIRGILIYVSHTFTWAIPYLKGLYLTTDYWCKGQYNKGYKVPRPRRNPSRHVFWKWDTDEWVDVLEDSLPNEPCSAPPEVFATPRLHSDVGALLLLFGDPTPAVISAWDSQVLAFYLMGDASGAGFESALWDDQNL